MAHLDEDDIRVRAGKGSRPRTRRRPAHESAAAGFVVTVDRGRYGCLIEEGADRAGPVPAGRMVTAMKARELGRNSVVVGDRVALAGDTSGAAGSLARIVRVEERASELRRSPDDTDPMERVIVANAQQMIIVCALADPAPKTRFIDRCLVAAYDAGLDPVLVLTKSDLAAPSPGGATPRSIIRTPRGVPDGNPSVSSTLREIRAFYKPLGIPMLTTRQPLPAVTLSRLRSRLSGMESVLIGQSGVGKSTLVNELIPDADRAVGHVNAVTGKGRHTSSSAIALRLPATARSADGGGWLIDTPGVRGFGLGHMSPQRVIEAFGDLAEGTANCPPGCDHLSADCALDEWIDQRYSAAQRPEAASARARLDSLRRLLRSRESAD
jgi:ribosome biogenesis GTPase